MMRIKRLGIIVAGASAGMFLGAPAQAQFWNPLDTVPKPNVIVGLDTSVTMGIDSGCNDCHRDGLPANQTRLFEATRDIFNTMPSIQDYFVFGGFRYEGCDYAKISERHIPTPDDPDISYNNVRNMVNGASNCGQRENFLPGGTAGGCITPTTGCVGDGPILQGFVDGTVNMPGLNIPLPVDTGDVTCDNPLSAITTYNLTASLYGKLGSGAFTWPRWDPAALPASQVQDDLCDPLENVFRLVETELSQCFLPATATSSVWDMSFLANPGTWCNPGQISNNACVGSDFVGTCVCDDTLPGCSNGVANTECNVPMTWKARQQVAVCETYNPDGGRFGEYFNNQTDNFVNGECRENAAIFITDGYEGQRFGVGVEAASARNVYRSAAGPDVYNMFVFRISNVFQNDANRLQRALTNNQVNTAFDATNTAQMQESFAQMLSRIYDGVYTGSNLATDAYQTRAVFHSFTVPGYDGTGPVSDDYLGFPSRVSVYEINTDGSVAANPTFESDWAARANLNPACRRAPINATQTNLFGPDNNFRNGVARNATIPANSTDRTGDGIVDNHPPLRYGRSFGFAAGQAVVVDRPADANPGTSAPEVNGYLNFLGDTDIVERPRVIYYTDGGYVIGIHGGEYTNTVPDFGQQNRAYGYDDGAAPAGAEVFRYKPGWVNNPALEAAGRYQYEPALNDLIQQPVTTGQIIAKEVWVNVGGTPQWRTVLAGNQGKEGPGYFIVDISDPCSPAAYAPVEIVLPNGAYASAKPSIYLIKSAADINVPKRSVLITTGGLEGVSEMYMYDIVSGAQVATVGLPAAANQSYPTEPICVDVTGEGAVTHCYLVRTDGMVVRVPLTVDGFGTPYDITPLDGGGSRPSMQPGRVYYTPPVAYFGSDGVVNLVFGSGDYRNLTQAQGGNAVFRMRDTTTRQANVPDSEGNLNGVCQPDSGSSTLGVFTLPGNERVLSPPTVSAGVVAWSTYVNAISGCIAGSGYVYAMDFETCADAINNNDRPQGVLIGDGIPTSPVLHRQSETLLVQTSAGPVQPSEQDDIATRGGGRPAIKRVFWRTELQNQ